MRRLVLRSILAIVAAAGGVAVAAAAAGEPVVGTWRLNVSKSTFTAGGALKSQTRTYSQSAQGITLVMKTVDADGREGTVKTTYQLDGKDYPVTGSPIYDSLSVKQIEGNTAEITLKKGGKVVGTGSRTVSKDGKTLTSKVRTTNAKGEKFEAVLVFDRQ